MLLLPPPALVKFPSIHVPTPPFQSLRHHHIHCFAAFSSTSNAASTSSSSSSFKRRRSDENDIPNRRYDFAPLLNFLSAAAPIADAFGPDSISGPVRDRPTALDPEEFGLAESYRAVPASLWHSLLKSLCSDSSSIGLAYAVVSWLQRHNLCFSYELLYSILIHALGRSEKLYEAFLLSQRHTLSPLTYNALISACTRNDDLEKALNLMERMRQDGFPSDFVNYSLVIRSLTRKNKIDSPILEKLYREIECDKIELDGQLLNDVIVGFAKAGDPTRAMHFLAEVQAIGLSPKTATLVAVISALGDSGRVVEAEALFEEIRDGGLQPRSRAYNALLKG